MASFWSAWFGAAKRRPSILMISIWAALAAPALAAASAPPVPDESAPASEAGIVPIEPEHSDEDLNAGLTMVAVPPSERSDSFSLPDVICEEDLLRGVGGPDCQPAGDYINAGALSNVFRANIYSVNRPRVLQEFSMKLNVSQTGRTLYFYVYERNIGDGKYYRLVEAIRPFPGQSGLDYYSSGTINVNLRSDSLSRYYLIGVAWQSPSVTFGIDTTTYPLNTPFGTIQGNSGLNSPPPLGTPLIVSLNRNGAYAQRLCFEPLPGACCQGSFCSVLQQNECANRHGVFSEEGNTCADIACPLQGGACCLELPDEDPLCTEATSFHCDELGGTYRGVFNSNGLPHMMGDFDNSNAIDYPDYLAFYDCSTNGSPPPPCYSEFDFPTADGDINLWDFAAFQVIFGDSQSVAQCVGDPCAPARGACCMMNGCAEFRTQEECALCPNSEWRGANTLCDATCPVLGACCSGICRERPGPGSMDPDECPGGVPWCPGLLCNEVNCQTGNCPAIGGCCQTDNTCDDAMTQFECQSMGGFFLGATHRCCEDQCPVFTGACCLPDGTCLDNLSQPDCVSSNGLWEGANTLCTDNQSCAWECCFYPSGCTPLKEAACTGAGGFPQGFGTTCASPCAFPDGACCFENGSCAVIPPADCEEISDACVVDPGVACGPPGFCVTDVNMNGTPDACE